MDTPTPTPALKQDASNRALRTFVVGLLIDVAVAVALVLVAATGAAEPNWQVLPALLLKTVVHSAASYVLRLKTTVMAPPARQPGPVAEGDPAP